MTCLLAGLQIFFGVVGLLAQWVEGDIAMTLIMTVCRRSASYATTCSVGRSPAREANSHIATEGA
jgi:hypothetical protein